MTTDTAPSLSPDEALLASYAADRALELNPPVDDAPIHERHCSIVSDLVAAHGTQPIDFERLHRASAADFRHDMVDIVGKVDHKTGALPKRFAMKCARKV